MNKFTKINQHLEKDRVFTTIWCTLDKSVISTLHNFLKPIKDNCEWVSTYGDIENNPKFIPHITLRYLGYTDELSKKHIIEDTNKFRLAMNDIGPKSISLSEIFIWQKPNVESIKARLNWKILNKNTLVDLHNRLLSVPGYQFFSSLEGDNYSPHISLGLVRSSRRDYIAVENYLKNRNIPELEVKLDKISINYVEEDRREDILIFKL